MKKKYIVTLTDEERRSLRALVSSGKGAARKLTHARIVLRADTREGGSPWTDAEIGEGVEVGTATVERVRKRFVEEGLEAALVPRKACREYPRKLDGDGAGVAADLVMIAQHTTRSSLPLAFVPCRVGRPYRGLTSAAQFDAMVKLRFAGAEEVVLKARPQKRLKNLLSALPDVDLAFDPAMFGLVVLRPVHPKLARRVQVATSHGYDLARPHTRQALKLNHRPHRRQEMR